MGNLHSVTYSHFIIFLGVSLVIRGYRQKKPGEMQVFAKAKDLIDYTFQTTENLKRFPKRVRFTLTNRLQDKSLQVFENLVEANEIYPSTSVEFHQRRTLQRKPFRCASS